MLTKLIRHEFRATSRIMWPIFAGMLALTLAMRASQNVLQNDFPWLLNLLAVLVTIGFVFGIMALCFAPLVLSAVRFRDHLLKDEGYLTLTLPVNMHQLLASKLIVSAVWYAAAFLAVVLLCMIGAFDFSDWRVVPQFASDLFLSFRKLDSSMQGQALLFALEVFLFCVLGVTAVSLIVYAAYAVGFSFNKHKSAPPPPCPSSCSSSSCSSRPSRFWQISSATASPRGRASPACRQAMPSLPSPSSAS